MGIIANWVEAYKVENNNENPFETLKIQRRTSKSCLAGSFYYLFQPKETNSIQLFKNLVGITDGYATYKLQEIIDTGANTILSSSTRLPVKSA